MTTTRPKPWCNYEHLGGCSDQLTHWANYWVGAARERYGPRAHWCAAHAADASHNGLNRLAKPVPRHPKPEPVKRRA
jgi:hypothetical protein